MEWYEIINWAAGLVGGTGGAISLYTAKAKRSSMEIENFKKLFDEAQEERENIRKLHIDYTNEMNDKIRKLEEKVEYMDRKNTIKIRAINSAYRCQLPEDIKDCPVLRTLDTECKDNENICKS